MALKQVDSLDSRVPQAAFYPGGQVLAGEPATIGVREGAARFLRWEGDLNRFPLKGDAAGGSG